ncbi:hypothetical protein BDN72DRAFT_846057 [Pluteus cervinus]|uniref:Uncharacterized protein n=1 Tax=Pluteus cervinus TaxID=181527 RepID=A0ACD3AHC1_9AGAR|nr:hypothetical protein BDN72DRAFT_846057 [Pluteus cervinus]
MFGSSDNSFRTAHCDLRCNEVDSTFVKGSWSIYTQKREKGREICPKVHLYDDQSAPQAFSGEDVAADHHRTITRASVALSPIWSRSQPQFRTLQRFRLVIQRLDCHIDEVDTIRDVIIGIRDAAQAQADAADKAKVIHWDISTKNIVVKTHWVNNEKKEIRRMQGYLIDWDLAVVEGAKEKLIRRMGTWYFIAAGLIPKGGKPTLPQNRLDGVESLFNVLVYVASHFTPHSWGSSTELSTFVYSYFYNGTSKIALLKGTGSPLVDELHHAPLKTLIGSLAKVLAGRYHIIDYMRYYIALGTERAKMLFNTDLAFRVLALEVLDDSHWLVDTLTRGLALTGWGPDDRLIKHTLLPMPGLNPDKWP